MIRAFDCAISAIALTILVPLFLVVAVLLRFTGEGEIFFRQTRVGFKGEHFNLFKFATMLKDSPNMGTGTVTTLNDPRVLRVGKVLRDTKINELPQLFNVLKGDMSLIGPRPQTLRCFSAFPMASQCEIIKVKPGLSGLGSIIFRDEEKMILASEKPDEFYDRVIMPYKGKVEEWFVKRSSLGNYLLLILLTIATVIAPNLNLVWKIYKDLPKPPSELDMERLKE